MTPRFHRLKLFGQVISRSLPGWLRRDRGLLVLLLLMLATLPFVTQRIYASDEIKYYAYLHSLFFDGDLDFTNDYQYWAQLDESKFGPLVRDMLKPNPNTGLPINEAPIGSALLWAPFYLLAHLFALAAGALGGSVQADGFSQPYISAVCYASFLYGWAGLLLGYSLLRRLFEPFAAALSIVTVWLATPAIVYTVIAPPWSHGPSLFAVTLFIFIWWRTRPAATRTPAQWALLGLSAGLMMMVREQDALFLSIPAVEVLLSLWGRLRGSGEPGISPRRHGGTEEERGQGAGGRGQGAGIALGAPDNRQPATGNRSLSTQHSALSTQYSSLVTRPPLMLFCAALAFTPQLAVYRVTNGTFRPSSTVGEKLTWWSPHFFEVLFSPQYGLITWTPLVLPALIGLALLARLDRTAALAFAAAFFAQVFIAGAFLTWMGASSFGQRRFINTTTILAFGLCALVAWLAGKGVARWLIVALAGAFIAWNAGLVMQYALWTSERREQGLIWPDIVAEQVRVYARLPELAWRFIFDRRSFMRPTAPD